MTSPHPLDKTFARFTPRTRNELRAIASYLEDRIDQMALDLKSGQAVLAQVGQLLTNVQAYLASHQTAGATDQTAFDSLMGQIGTGLTTINDLVAPVTTTTPPPAA